MFKSNRNRSNFTSSEQALTTAIQTTQSSSCNVLIVISNLEFGGAQRQIVELTKHLDARFNVTLCSLSDYIPLASQCAERVDVTVIKKEHRFDVTVPLKLAKLIKEKNIDLVHSFLFDADIAARVATALLSSPPTHIASERNTDYSLKKVQLLAHKITRRWVDAVIANSHTGSRFHQKIVGLPKTHYHVVYNGVDTERFKPFESPLDDHTFRVTHSLTGKILIGMFASFKSQKNHPLLLKAFKRLIALHPECKLLLVGDQLAGGQHGSDQYKSELLEQIDSLNLSDHIISMGNHPEVETLYTACDFTVLPSRFEGLPNVVLESLASGVPVVATDVSDNAHIIKNGETGYVVPSEDESELFKAMLRLVKAQKRRTTMGHAARKTAMRDFSCHALAKHTANVYSQLLFER